VWPRERGAPGWLLSRHMGIKPLCQVTRVLHQMKGNFMNSEKDERHLIGEKDLPIVHRVSRWKELDE
jgi:hypothetical protein